ncbi:MAG: hypothetical protein BA865_07200 [Desulfobacterales bacterium S5133MH4]|nr:MAG: hypothetical protein BA865_07200 [Desulfobacterales bacterium S5133MH4]
MEKNESKKTIFILMILSTLLFLVSCQTIDKRFFPYEFNATEYKKVSDNKKVFLSPVQLITDQHLKNQHPENKNFYDALDFTMKSYLEGHGYEVLSSEKFSATWNKNKKATGGLYEQNTGQISQHLVNECLSKTITDLRQKNDFSAIVIPQAIYQHIELKEKSLQWGVWDGVKRIVKTEGGIRNGWKSHLAISVSVIVISQNLKPVFRSRGGIDFLTKSVYEDRTFKRMPKSFEEFSLQHLSEAVEIVFHPFIESPIVEYAMPESYLEMVRLKIERHKKYPDTAKIRQIEGNVTVRFIITFKGSLYGVEIVKSSGHRILDTAAIKAVNDADPFPKPPARFFKEDIPLELTIVFESTCFERKTL